MLGADYGGTCLHSWHLSFQDISINNRANPHLVRVTIKQSKTDPFRKGVHIYLGATDSTVCPVLGVLPYVTLRETQAEPLFITEHSEGLTQKIFSMALDSLLADLQLNHTHYSSHSFRIGAATTAAQANIPDACIKMLGRWQSNAYQRYIKTPPQELAKFSMILATASDQQPAKH